MFLRRMGSYFGIEFLLVSLDGYTPIPPSPLEGEGGGGGEHERPAFQGRRAVALQVVQDAVHLLLDQLLVEVVVHLHHGPGPAGRQAFDCAQREKTVRGRLAGLDAELGVDPAQQLLRAYERAHQRAADLDVVLADRLAVEHRVERRGLIDLRRREAQQPRDLPHRRLWYVPVLLLRQPEQRQQGRSLFWVAAYDLRDLVFVFLSQHPVPR